LPLCFVLDFFFGEPLVESRLNAMVIKVGLVFQGSSQPIIVV
jgi:hypothetical protein